ncbi:MAG: response regulator transcription factor [Paracoccaceae bacterium]
MNFLVVEDHPLVSSGMAQVLENWRSGTQVTIATGYNDLPDHLPSAFSAVLLDLDLGNGIEFETLHALKTKFPNTPVIILSGSNNPMVIKRSRAFGATAFIRKGERVERILEIIDLVVRGGNSIFPENLVPLEQNVDLDRKMFRRLTRREGEVFQRLCKGGTNKAIGLDLGIEEKTVRAHLTEIYRKLGVKNRTEAILL